MRHKTRSVEEKALLRIARKDPSQRRIQAIKKCFHTVVEKPIMFLLHVTIPTSEKEKWRRNFAMVNPLFATLFFFFSSHSKYRSVILISLYLSFRPRCIRSNLVNQLPGECRPWSRDKVLHAQDDGTIEQSRLPFPDWQLLNEHGLDCHAL